MMSPRSPPVHVACSPPLDISPWGQGREAAQAPCQQVVGDGTTLPIGDTLQRFGLALPSLLPAWAVWAKANPSAVGEGAASDHLLGLGSDGE